jgi:hypothetical protein
MFYHKLLKRGVFMGCFKRSGKISACIGVLLAASFSFSDFLIDDFNDGNNRNEIDAYWYFYDDYSPGGSSIVNNDPFEEYGIEDGVAVMDFTLGDSVDKVDYMLYPFVGMGFNFDGEDGKTNFDLTGATALKFRAKGDQKFVVKLLIETSNVTDDNKLHHKFEVTQAWREVTVLLEKDPDLGLTQENWGSSSPKRDYDPTKVQKLAFQVRGNENKTLKDGKLYIDDLVLVGNPKIKAWGELDTVSVGTYTGKGLLSDFEGDYPFENKIKGEWYNYTDGEIDGSSAFTKGVDQDGNLIVDEDGGVSGCGISVSFLLGEKIEGVDDSIAPFCGIGTNVTKGGKSYNAKEVGATGIYFEYKSDLPIVVEVEDSIKRGDGAVYFAKLPSTGGNWAGAVVPFDSLKLPKWVGKGVAKLATTNLKKIQFKLTGNPNDEGSFSIDNLYLMNAELVNVKQRIQNLAAKGIKVNQRNNQLNIQLDNRLGDSKISLVNPVGKIVLSKRVSSGARYCTLPLSNRANGVYLLKISSANGNVETLPLNVTR